MKFLLTLTELSTLAVVIHVQARGCSQEMRAIGIVEATCEAIFGPCNEYGCNTI
jgi:hypothetical protein